MIAKRNILLLFSFFVSVALAVSNTTDVTVHELQQTSQHNQPAHAFVDDSFLKVLTAEERQSERDAVAKDLERRLKEAELNKAVLEIEKRMRELGPQKSEELIKAQQELEVKKALLELAKVQKEAKEYGPKPALLHRLSGLPKKLAEETIDKLIKGDYAWIVSNLFSYAVNHPFIAALVVFALYYPYLTYKAGSVTVKAVNGAAQIVDSAVGMIDAALVYAQTPPNKAADMTQLNQYSYPLRMIIVAPWYFWRNLQNALS